MLSAQADVEAMFQKNAEATPLQIHGGKYNPWEFEDYVFHMPYFAETDSKHTADTQPAGSICCVCPDVAQPDENAAGWAWTLLARLLGGRETKKAAPVNEMETEHVGFCFVRKAVTICVVEHSDQSSSATNTLDEDHLHKNAQSLSTNWTALLIDPDAFLHRALATDPDQRFLNGALPPSARNPAKLPRPRWHENQNADFFQTRLIGVALHALATDWQLTTQRLETHCDSFDRAVRAHMPRPAYWRGPVNTTLIAAHKLARALAVLEQSLKDTIGDPDDPATSIAVWKKSRRARPRRRMKALEAAWEAGGHAPKDVPRRKEMNRLRHLLWDVCDVHAHRLFTAQARLRARREAVDGLRELLIDLSQTRASLYANQLGDHVRFLTYVSIVFLPLSFCVALWSMNYDVHSKTAFVITTCLASVGVVVFLAVLMAYHHDVSVNH